MSHKLKLISSLSIMLLPATAYGHVSDEAAVMIIVIMLVIVLFPAFVITLLKRNNRAIYNTIIAIDLILIITAFKSNAGNNLLYEAIPLLFIFPYLVLLIHVIKEKKKIDSQPDELKS